MTSRLRVVAGPPCAGKSTHVDERSAPRDVVIDLDRLAHALGYPTAQVRWDDEHHAIAAAKVARRALIEAATAGQLDGITWLVDARPHPTSLRIYRRIGARVTVLDPGRDECRRRAVAAGRDESVLEQIDRWYADPMATTSARRSRALNVFD